MKNLRMSAYGTALGFTAWMLLGIEPLPGLFGAYVVLLAHVVLSSPEKPHDH